MVVYCIQWYEHTCEIYETTTTGNGTFLKVGPYSVIANKCTTCKHMAVPRNGQLFSRVGALGCGLHYKIKPFFFRAKLKLAAEKAESCHAHKKK